MRQSALQLGVWYNNLDFFAFTGLLLGSNPDSLVSSISDVPLYYQVLIKPEITLKKKEKEKLFLKRGLLKLSLLLRGQIFYLSVFSDQEQYKFILAKSSLMATYNAIFYDKLKTESDQKDLLIAQLKAEIFELRQNEKDQALLRQQIANLESRNQTLNEDKIIKEKEWTNRADLQQSSINNLKDDLTVLQGSLSQKELTEKDLRSQVDALNGLLNSRERDIADQKLSASDQSKTISLLRADLINSEELNAKLRDERALANADIDRLTAQNARLQQDNLEGGDRLTLERAEKDRLNRRIVELLDANDIARAEARRKEEALTQTQKSAIDAQERLNLLRNDLRDTQLQAERHREDARTMTKLQEEERLRAIRAQQRAEEAEREKRDRELQAQYLRREAENARFEKSRLLDEKLGQDEELEALREHCDVVSTQNRELGRELDRFADQDELVRNTLDRKHRVNYIRGKNDDELGRSIRKVEIARSRSGSPAKRSPARRY